MDIYKRESDKTKLYRKSFCAFIDVLGFSEKIKEENLNFFSTYLTTLDKLLNYLKKNHDLENLEGFKSFELKIFTDNIVFGHPWNDESGESELGDIFDILSKIQFDLICANVFVRGAISISNLYMDENIVLGPALIESYKLESTKAIFPRIILSDEVKKTVQEHIDFYAKGGSPQIEEYLIDKDGVPFFNYLTHVLRDSAGHEQKISDDLKKHKDVIELNLMKFQKNYEIVKKYNWSGQYHNYFIQRFMPSINQNWNFKQLIIDEKLLSREFKTFE